MPMMSQSMSMPEPPGAPWHICPTSHRSCFQRFPLRRRLNEKAPFKGEEVDESDGKTWMEKSTSGTVGTER